MSQRRRRHATPVALLRAASWAIIAVAVWSAGNMPGPGGAATGLVLGGTLAAYLVISRNG